MSEHPDDLRAVQLTLVRHGESTFNERGLYQGASDVPILTAKGQEQATAAAALLQAKHFDAFYVSPLRRARKTADFLRQKLENLPSETVMPLLREIELPEWEGRPFSDVIAHERTRHQSWKFSPDKFEMRDHNGKALAPGQDILARARAFTDMLQRDRRGQSILAVAHGGTIRAILSVLLDMPGDRLHTVQQENCAVTTLSCLPQGATRIVQLNRAVRPERERLERAISANKAVFVIAAAHVATVLQRDHTFAATIDAEQRPIDLLRENAITGPTLLRAEIGLQAQLMGDLLGLPAAPGHCLGLHEDGFHMVQACTPTGPGALDILNGRVNIADSLDLTSSTLLKEAG